MQAELVALGVEHGDPVAFGFVELGDVGGADRHQVRRTCVEFGRVDVHVEVHPILRGLALGHLEEEHSGADTVGIDNGERSVRVGPVDAERVERRLPGDEAGRRRLLDVAEHLAPELGELAGPSGVDGDLNRSCHRPIIAHLAAPSVDVRQSTGSPHGPDRVASEPWEERTRPSK